MVRYLQQQVSRVWRRNRRCISCRERVSGQADWEQETQIRRYYCTDEVQLWEQLADPTKVYLLDVAHAKRNIHQFLHFEKDTALAQEVALNWGYGRGKPVSIYIRQCYSVISDGITKWVDADSAMYGPAGIVLLGNPGIGKTGFLVYKLWCTVVQNRGNAIIRFKDRAGPFYAFKWVHSKLEVSIHETLKSASHIFDSPPWYFCDSGTDDFNVRVKCLVTCSPVKNNYSRFAKNGDIKLMYAPVWTLEEILVLNKQVFGLPIAKVRKRFGRWGGIPRFVLGKEDNFSILDTTMSKITNFQGVRNAETTLAIDEVIHEVFHFAVNDTCTTYRTTLASRYVSAKIYEIAQLRRSDEFCQWFATIGKGIDALPYLGELFEEEFHSFIQEGHTYFVRGVGEKNGMGSFMVFTRLLTQMWLLPSVDKQGAATEAKFPANVLDSSMYLRPMTQNNKGFDSIALYDKKDDTPARIFQMIVSDNENKNRQAFASGVGRALRYLGEVRPGPVQVFFVVPEYRFAKFTFDPEKLGPEFSHVTFFVLLLDVRRAK